MTMFVQLLVFTCACALGAADELANYKNVLDQIVQAHNNLQQYVLSMDGNVPLLNDSRRHYAGIIHVVYDEAVHEDSCIGHDYYKDYQKNVNQSAPFAFANPQSVVDEIQKLTEDILNATDKVVQLIEASAESDNEAIDEKLIKNDELNGFPKKVFLATGIFATQLNKNHEHYLERSEEQTALRFVITGADKLKSVVMALTNLHKLLYGHYEKC